MSSPVIPSISWRGEKDQLRVVWPKETNKGHKYTLFITEDEMLGLLLAYDAFMELQDVFDETVTITPEGREALAGPSCGEEKCCNSEPDCVLLADPSILHIENVCGSNGTVPIQLNLKTFKFEVVLPKGAGGPAAWGSLLDARSFAEGFAS